MSISFKSLVGHRLREAQLHLKRMTYPKIDKRLVMFPWSSLDASSSRERAYNLGKHLRARGWRVTIVPFQLE